MEDGSYAMLLATLVFTAVSAYFSAVETAFSTVNKIRLKNHADAGDKKARLALSITDDYDRMISTILIGNNLMNIAIATLSALVFTEFFGAAGAAISAAVSTLVVLTFCEILPKSFARQNAERICIACAGSLRFIMLLLTPFSLIFSKMQDAFSRLTASGEKSPLVTEEELKYIIDTIEDEGVLQEQEADLVQSALEFSDITVQEVLTPRVDLVALDVDDDIDTILATVIEERYTRMPVYERTVDHIIGVLQSRDLLEAIVRGEKHTLDLRGMLTEPLYIHKTKKLSALLAEFQRERVHLAIVTDDYGGTMGIVTLEDLLEQLVGEIWDEDEEIEIEFTDLGGGLYLVSGDMGIEDFFEEAQFDDPDFTSDSNTLGGWALEELQHLPEVGESFEYKGIAVTIQEVADQRIMQMLIALPQPAEGEQP